MYHVYINTKQYTLKETTEIVTRFILASRLVFTIMKMTWRLPLRTLTVFSIIKSFS